MSTPLIVALVLLLGIPLAIVLLVYLLIPAGKGVAWFVRHIYRFVFSMFSDALRLIGAILTGIVLIPITIGNVLIGRWSGAAHYGRAIEAEAKSGAACFFRLVIGNPARLFCLGALTEGLERRIPHAVANAPGADAPSRRVGQFDGYKIVGSLPGGGSGGRLYVAEPSPERLTAFARAGQPGVDKVVIKCFSLLDGSSLPQIVRENRALVAAKRLGLILDDDLAADRFFYVMRYVPGDSLGVVSQRLHSVSGPDGLSGKQLTEAMDYSADLLRTLHHYHQGGLWHKDVKPDNIIVSAGQAHLVDFGLITPLRSSMTLTTHGTEYFRDPEMVRMALRGVKVHEVDGAKFDIYAAGAVLYSVIENSFPAHGGLSQITKRCPEALRWIVRRAMTDYDKRYDSAATMLTDVEAVLASPDPFLMKPVDLPSVRAGQSPDMPAPEPAFGFGRRGSPIPTPAPIGDEFPPASANQPRRSPSPIYAAAAAAPFVAGIPAAVAGMGAKVARAPFFRVTNWWTGKYDSDNWGAAAAAAGAGAAGFGAMNAGANASPADRFTPRSPRPNGMSAAAQVANARGRAEAARQRAHARMGRFRKDFPGGVNSGVVVAFLVFLALVGLVVTSIVMPRMLTHAWAHAFGSDGEAAQDMADLLASAPPVVIELGEGNRFELTPEVKTVSIPSHRADGRIYDDRRAHRPSAQTPPVTFGNVMILRDPFTYTKDHTGISTGQLASLAAAGFRLSGEQDLFPADSDAARTSEEHTLADLKSEVGVRPFASTDAGAAIRAWLDRMPAYTMVAWLGQSDDGRPETWVVARNGADPDLVRHAGEALHAPIQSAAVSALTAAPAPAATVPPSPSGAPTPPPPSAAPKPRHRW